MKYGLKWDTKDHRDKPASKPKMFALPASVDMRAIDNPIYDQGQLGSCTANGGCGAYQFKQKQQKEAAEVSSRLYLYFNTRTIEGTPGEDSGASIRDTFKAMNKQGVCSEKSWPYDVSKFTKKPPQACYTEGATKTITKYAYVDQNKDAIKAQLAAGNPIVFGFSVFDDFESDRVAKTGIVRLPGKDESPLGGHCVVAVGYDAHYVICRNSWGSSWALRGYFKIPWTYILNPDLADDFWILESVN